MVLARVAGDSVWPVEPVTETEMPTFDSTLRARPLQPEARSNRRLSFTQGIAGFRELPQS